MPFIWLACPQAQGGNVDLSLTLETKSLKRFGWRVFMKISTICLSRGINIESTRSENQSQCLSNFLRDVIKNNLYNSLIVTLNKNNYNSI